MANLEATKRTALAGEDVILRAVQFFTRENWTPQTQSSRSVTFLGTPKVPVGGIILYVVLVLGGMLLTITVIGAILGIPMIIVGAVLGIRSALRLRGLSGRPTLVVTTSSAAQGTDVSVTYPTDATGITQRFLGGLAEE